MTFTKSYHMMFEEVVWTTFMILSSILKL